ncbi:NapC/NirT family cytochrome c [Thermosipho ferrireducens]|uniref:NapC/NirT family cytochrome c n=1 Tax=Thermosipho ferrireducens TaxID=2571116 RepID=A0ABX7S638_9BACT|nr:NapC/NirT family cytochrome c [Thermosipho ferrireducens]QTA38038.1 NapC/NirT family cytochrome c [Thermosipho ferrireducens]
MKVVVDFFKLLFEVVVAGFNLILLFFDFVRRHVHLSEKIAIILLGVFILGGIGLVIAIEATSTNSFCLTCHPYFEKEFYETSHGEAGVDCADCHIPSDIAGFTRAKLGGLREAWIYFTQDHPENREDWYNNYKEHWEKIAYEKNLTEETCLECHGESEEIPYMEVEAYGINIHQQLKVKEKGLSCFDCHYNFVHGVLEWEDKK